MVIQLAAAALGRGLMGAGSKMAGPAATKSMSGRGLKTGSMMSKKDSINLNRLAKTADVSLKFMSKISKGISKFVGFMAKHSPALKQQLIVLRKGISVFLRPIGDIMAKFMRPMAVWVMKVAQKWYSIFGTGSKEKTSNSYIEDQIKQLETEKESAIIAGDDEGAAKIQEQIDALQGKLKSSLWDNIANFFTATLPQVTKDAWNGIVKFFNTTLPKAAQDAWNGIVNFFNITLPKAAGDAWNSILNFFGTDFPYALGRFVGLVENFFTDTLPKAAQKAWDNINKFFEETLPNAARDAWARILRYGQDVYDNIGAFFRDTLPKAIKDAWNGIDRFFTITIPGWFQTLVNKFTNAWDRIKNFGSNTWDSVKDAGKNFISGYKSTKAVGGSIAQTGLYQLHAGERVVTSGDVQRANNSNSMSVNNTFNISATINNDMDIRELANRLADLNETELRRRVSYI